MLLNDKEEQLQQNNFIVRPAANEDFEDIYAIWTAGIVSTFDGMPKPSNLKEQFFEEFNNRNEHFNFWVAVIEEKVVGWCSIHPLTTNRIQNKFWGEVSTYINEAFKHHGIGICLMKEVFRALKDSPIQFVFGFAKTTNVASIGMCHLSGMTTICTLPVPMKGPAYDVKEILVMNINNSETVPANL